jgi:hypothetical protein
VGQAKDDVTKPAAPPASTKSTPLSSRHSIRQSHGLLSKVAIELFIVFVGVSAAFAVDNYRASRADDVKRDAVYQALDRELSQIAETRGPVFQKQMNAQLKAWDEALAHGQKPLPPTFRLAGAERPPTGVWNAAVASGSIELIDPELFYELARFYNRAESAGDFYQRYSAGAQTSIWPYLAEGPKAFWGADGEPTREVRASVQRLRDFRDRQGALDVEAQQMRAKLRKAASRS